MGESSLVDEEVKKQVYKDIHLEEKKPEGGI